MTGEIVNCIFLLYTQIVENGGTLSWFFVRWRRNELLGLTILQSRLCRVLCLDIFSHSRLRHRTTVMMTCTGNGFFCHRNSNIREMIVQGFILWFDSWFRLFRQILTAPIQCFLNWKHHLDFPLHFRHLALNGALLNYWFFWGNRHILDQIIRLVSSLDAVKVQWCFILWILCVFMSIFLRSKLLLNNFRVVCLGFNNRGQRWNDRICWYNSAEVCSIFILLVYNWRMGHLRIKHFIWTLHNFMIFNVTFHFHFFYPHLPRSPSLAFGRQGSLLIRFLGWNGYIRAFLGRTTSPPPP